jgi:hypothetical protein
MMNLCWAFWKCDLSKQSYQSGVLQWLFENALIIETYMQGWQYLTLGDF